MKYAVSSQHSYCVLRVLFFAHVLQHLRFTILTQCFDCSFDHQQMSELGMRSEFTKTGTVRALFSPLSGKVKLLEFSFDAVRGSAQCY